MELKHNKVKIPKISRQYMKKLERDLDKANKKQLQKIIKLLEMELSNPMFAEKFMESQCIDIGPFLVHTDIYQQYLKVQENKIPCGYIWFDITDLKADVIGLKNGQASTGDVRSRVKSFGSRGKKILIDVLEDDVFKNKGYDQKLNLQIESDYYESYKIEVEDTKTVRTRENVLVPRSLIFDFPQLKRNTLSRILNKQFSKRTFHSSNSHEECLKKLTTNSKQQFFLLDCVMRFGKSFIYYEYLKREWVDKGKVGIHTVFCHDTKTVDGWLEKLDIYYTELYDCVLLKDDKSFDFNRKVEKNTIVFISQQLLHSNKDNSNPNETYTQPLHSLIKLDVRCDNTFVDEVHQYFSPKWKSYFESITTDRILLASGTAAKIKLQYPDLFDEYNTHTDTLKDLKGRLFREFGIEVITNIKRLNVSQLGFGFVNMANLQSLDENGNLANPSLGIEFCDAIFNGYRTSPMTQEQISKNPKHCPIYVDTVEFGKLIFQYLTDNPQLNIIPILVTGRSKERTVKNETELKKFIKKQNSDGKSTVTITCGSMIQGVSIEEWKDMINLSVVTTYEMFYQFFGRGWEIDTTKMRGKTVHITMWDYNPHRTLKVAAQFVQSLAMTNGLDIPKAFQHYFQIHNIWDYVPERNSFQQICTSAIESEIREFVDSQVLTSGCKARLVTNIRPEVMGDISNELLDVLLSTQKVKITGDTVTELEAYKNDIGKQKTNHSKKSHELDIPKIPKQLYDIWQSAIDGLSVYTERIPIVTEVMFKKGKLKTKNVIELMSKSQDECFITGFRFPNSLISQQFSEYILRHGNLQKINLKVDNSVNLIPVILECLDMSRDDFLKVGDTFDDIYKYGGSDTQLSVRDTYNILKEELKNIKATVGQKFVVKDAKSGSINLALTYLLKENSKKIFGRKLTNGEIIESVSYEDENTFFNSLINTMGFSKTKKTKKDFIIINPPYKKGFHIGVFNKSFEELSEGGTLICLHPSTPFLNSKPTDDGETIKIRNIVNEYHTELKFINGNDIFDNADLMVPLSITKVTKIKDSRIFVTYSHFDSSVKNKNEYNSIDSIFLHGNDLVLSIKDKIEKKGIKGISNFLFRNGYRDNFYIRINRISGHAPKRGDKNVNPDFYQLLYKKDENDFNRILTITPDGKKGNGGALNELGFSNKEQVKNGFEFLKTKFARFCLSLRKTGSDLNNIDLEFVPYMDFSQKWTDEKLFNEFGLTQKEREFINEYIPNWYECDGKSN